MAAAYPDMFHLARQCRQFLIRAVRFAAAEAGLGQFLDLGCGLPTQSALQDVHEIAQAVDRSAWVVYVDNDRVVASHVRASAEQVAPGHGPIAYWEADVRDVDEVLAASAGTLDFSRQIAKRPG